MEQFKKIRIFFDQDFEAVIKKIRLHGVMKNVAVDGVKILKEIIKFFEEVKNEDYKALLAKYEIKNENYWFLYALFYNVQSLSLRQ